MDSVGQLFFFPVTSFPLSFWPQHSDFALGQIIPLTLLLKNLSSSKNSRDIGLVYQRHIPDHKGLFRDGHMTSESIRWNIGILAGNIEKGILYFFSQLVLNLEDNFTVIFPPRRAQEWSQNENQETLEMGQTDLRDRISTFEKKHSWNSHTLGFLVTWVSTF